MANESNPSKGAEKTSRRRWPRRVALALLLVLVFGGAMMGGMEYYTSRPRFCGTCHIMQPYYQSWNVDAHATKADAACVDCHYAPGEQHTIKAKMRGLSQMVSYVSGRAGGRRPRPQVVDASCLREGCHKVEEFADKKYPVRDVQFVHAKHIKPDSAVVQENTQRLETVRAQLEGSLSPQAMERLDRLVARLEDPERLGEQVALLLQPIGLAGQTAAGVEFIQRERNDIRYRQVADNLRCTTCHSYTGEKEHFGINTSVCNTCHFSGQMFNTDTGECLKCHNPPQIQVPVHARTVSEAVGPAVRAGTMDHSVIIEKKIDCRSCHADLVQGTGLVQRDRCSACHDLARYFVDFDQNLNTATVHTLHEKHVADLVATCTDCHGPIRHKLQPKDAMTMTGGFLEPVRDNCAHCHPDHHRFQVEMLIGQPPHPIPHGGANAMFGSRVNCLGCHTHATTDPKGTPLVEATRQACVICHTQDYQELFDQWVTRLEIRQKEVAQLHDRVMAAVARRGDLPQLDPEARRLTEQGRAILDFVMAAKGIHNRNYALNLLDEAEMDLIKALRQMGEPVPATQPSSQPAPAAQCPANPLDAPIGMGKTIDEQNPS